MSLLKVKVVDNLKGVRLAVNPTTKESRLTCKPDRDLSEISQFCLLVAREVISKSKVSMRGRVYITKDALRVTMYNHNRQEKVTVFHKRVTK